MELQQLRIGQTIVFPLLKSLQPRLDGILPVRLLPAIARNRAKFP
ncbi:MAG: hypothetical protein U7126_11055 [Microcoleus sp.]